MTTLPDPTSGDFADLALVAWFPRANPALAEAWPVLDWRTTASGSQIVVTTELQGELRFRRATMTMIGVSAYAAECPMLIPADDIRAREARERTDVMRAANVLRQVISRHRPDRTTPTAQLLADIEMIRDAAVVAYDDIAELIGVRQP